MSKKYYVYEKHTRGVFLTDERLKDEALYCSVCDKSDKYIGNINTVEELVELFTEVDKMTYDIRLRYSSEYLHLIYNYFRNEIDRR